MCPPASAFVGVRGMLKSLALKNLQAAIEVLIFFLDSHPLQPHMFHRFSFYYILPPPPPPHTLKPQHPASSKQVLSAFLILRITRILRAVRTLKLLSFTPGLRNVAEALVTRSQ